MSLIRIGAYPVSGGKFSRPFRICSMTAGSITDPTTGGIASETSFRASSGGNRRTASNSALFRFLRANVSTVNMIASMMPQAMLLPIAAKMSSRIATLCVVATLIEHVNVSAMINPKRISADRSSGLRRPEGFDRTPMSGSLRKNSLSDHGMISSLALGHSISIGSTRIFT